MIARSLTIAVALLAFAGAAHATPVPYSQGPGTFQFTAPNTGTYSIDLIGGQGGSAFHLGGPPVQVGGDGADASAVFALTAGEVLDITVGAAGVFQGTLGSGGAGSFVYVNGANTLLLAAGGGGGATTCADLSCTFSADGDPASIVSTPLTVSGGNVAGVDGGTGLCCAFPMGVGAGGASYINTNGSDGFISSATLRLNTAGGDGRVTIDELTSVPEPASLPLLVMGLAGLGLVVRRRRA
jgi:PEP-CTERM motif-containing protein